MSQLFKDSVPDKVLYDFLNEHCQKNGDTIKLNKVAYKRALIKNKIHDFLEIIKPYYHLSKQFYVTRDMTYTRFTNIIRQICKNNALPYDHKIHYDHSKYEIVYYIVESQQNNTDNVSDNDSE